MQFHFHPSTIATKQHTLVYTVIWARTEHHVYIIVIKSLNCSVNCYTPCMHPQIGPIGILTIGCLATYCMGLLVESASKLCEW